MELLGDIVEARSINQVFLKINLFLKNPPTVGN